jgi:site-specific DNA-methyltransferase (adenine-specific)
MVNLLHGDCLEVLKTLPDDSVDSLVTDPPAGISFMNKKFDTFSGRDHFVSNMRDIFIECLRVMKPGAHGLVWALPRTSHWTATALEDAGFDVRDVITHLFGSGFPKSHDISKGIDKAAGVERPSTPLVRCDGKTQHNKEGGGWAQSSDKYVHHPVFDGSTDAAKQWAGWGTALKPASEHWILIRKPLSEKTVAANVLRWNCGGLNIDASRVGNEQRVNKGVPSYQGATGTFSGQGEIPTRSDKVTQGRFPANLVFSHNDDCVEVGVKKVKNNSGSVSNNHSSESAIFGTTNRPEFAAYKDSDGTETVSAFECSEGCAVAELDRQSGEIKTKLPFKKISDHTFTPGEENKGQKFESQKGLGITLSGASRFFYCAKASKGERNTGLEGMPLVTVRISGQGAACPKQTKDGRPNSDIQNQNHHPTVKPTRLMSYLIKLVTPPNGIVLDPFLGSGTTGVAAKREGFSFIGIEREPEYLEIAERRIEHV